MNIKTADMGQLEFFRNAYETSSLVRDGISPCVSPRFIFDQALMALEQEFILLFRLAFRKIFQVKFLFLKRYLNCDRVKPGV